MTSRDRSLARRGLFPLTRTYGIVHGVARCMSCEWETGSYKNCQAISAAHAKKYGHRVEGEIGIAFSYTGTKGEKK